MSVVSRLAVTAVILTVGLPGCFRSHERPGDSDSDAPGIGDGDDQPSVVSKGDSGGMGGPSGTDWTDSTNSDSGNSSVGLNGETRPIPDTKPDGGAPTDRRYTVSDPEEATACGRKYKPAIVCEQTASACAFYVVLNGSTCLDYCEAHGGECIAAWSDSDHGCENEGHRQCDESVEDQICTCTLTTSDFR